MTTAADLKWGPPPPVFEQNAEFAVVSGDPGKSGLYVVRLRMPAGYKIQAHGGYGLLPANMRHFAMATKAATIQVHGMGPFQLTYVNPADDPSTRAKPK